MFVRLRRKRRCLDILPAGAIYTDESHVDIDGNTSFGYNSAKGEPRRNRGVEEPRYLIWSIAIEGSLYQQVGISVGKRESSYTRTHCHIYVRFCSCLATGCTPMPHIEMNAFGSPPRWQFIGYIIV